MNWLHDALSSTDCCMQINVLLRVIFSIPKLRLNSIANQLLARITYSSNQSQ